MSYKILTVPPFDKQLKRLAKKYPSIKNDIIQLISELQNQPVKGTNIGNNCFKVRMAITSKGKGKSAGARVITHFVLKSESIYMLSIYDKAEQCTISDNEIHDLLMLIQQN
jgi:mRNA-degrading endonuclease RelE of RelBE toxin-antitoxin system